MLFIYFRYYILIPINFYLIFQTTWAPNTQVVAQYEFKAISPHSDLPFNKSERLTIVGNTDDPNWVKARNTRGQEGLIPASYVTIYNQFNSMPRKKGNGVAVIQSNLKWDKQK